MRTLVQLSERIKDYRQAEFIYREGIGYIVWHLTTGDNIEMLFIEVEESQRGKGHATNLYRAMVQQIVDRGQVPYHSVIGYRLASNKGAELFYTSLGFTQVNLGQSIYRDDYTILMWVTWKDLVRNLGV